ncbi:glycosyl transferase [Salmonella enterica subsp. enterica serovar Choleraesuis]|nr:glycosyl transferase [Salmonella enterica subsp. enterica serovar Choleraesuis]
MNEVFSIIMPAFNAEKTISKSIESVLNQTYRDFKLYIIDDNSTDQTQSIIQDFLEKDDRIVYVKKDINSGVADTRNVGIERCAGIYISFLDADDLWREDKLTKQLKILSEGWDVVCSNYIAFRSDDFSIFTARKSPQVITYERLLQSNFIGNLTGVYNAVKLGKIFQKKVGHEDYIMWLDILRKSKSAFCVQENLASYRLSNGSLSSNKLKAIRWQWNIYRDILGFSVIKAMYYFSCYIAYAFIKRH